MSRRKTRHTKHFKPDALIYPKVLPGLTQAGCDKNHGFAVSTPARRVALFSVNVAVIHTIGSASCESDEPRESARL